MSRILGYPAVRQVNSREWELLEDLEYHVGSEDSTDIIIVPKGFITDFASSPKWTWWIVPPFGRYSPCAVIHDFLYRNGLRTRKECDDIFLEAMVVMDVPVWQRNLIYGSVRIFGGPAYNN